MINRKHCENCNKKISQKNNFCPNCGAKIKESGKEWGMLGRKDSTEKNDFQNPLFGGFSGKIFNSMIGSAMKMLEKEMEKEIKSQEMHPKTNFRLMINGKEVKLNENRIPEQKKEVIIKKEFEEKQLKNFIKLKKEEPKTNLKRLGNKITYEIEMPEVKSFNDILIKKLENSIEIKAIGKTKAYFKIIPVNMLITNQELNKGKLILELEEN